MYQGSFLELPNATPAAVALVDTNGDQIPGFDASRPANAAITTPAVTVADSIAVPANPARRQVIVSNTASKKLYLAFGAAASPSSYTYAIPANGSWESPLNGFTGAIHACWGSGTGSILVTEVTS